MTNQPIYRRQADAIREHSGAAGFASPYVIPFRNDAGAEIPAFAILRPTGIVERSGRWCYKVEKPSTTVFVRRYLINGPTKVPDGGYGSAADGSTPCLALRESTTPTFGHGWGPKGGAWTLDRYRPGMFTALGESSTDHILITQVECNVVKCKLTGALSSGGSQTANLLYGSPPSSTESSIAITVYDDILTSPDEWADDTEGEAVWINGAWYFAGKGCP